MVSLRYATPALLLLLSGCVVGPDHVPPEMALPGKFSEGGKKSIGDVATTAWWTAYNDRKLDSLVQTGLSQNLTIQQALERINSASANVTIAGAGSLPALDVGASHTVSGETGELRTQFNTRNTSAGQLSLSWLLDMPKDAIPAARVLGANWFQVFWKVILPLTREGLVVGGTLVFTGSLTAYITPAILGGSKVLMLETLMYQQVSVANNFVSASVIAFILIVMSFAANILLKRLATARNRR